MPIKKKLQRYENTLYFSVSNESNDGKIENDLMLEGSGDILAAGLAQQMQRHPELKEFFEYALDMYDKLISLTE